MALAKKHFPLLHAIAAAMTDTAAPFLMVSETDLAPLIKEQLVDTNAEIRDGDKVATRLNEKGSALNTENPAIPAGTEPTVAPTVTASTSSYAIVDGVTLPPKRGGRNGGSSYPFEAMNIGQSFFVPSSAAKPNPAKSLASTITSANKRLAPKKFTVAPVEAGKVYGTFTAPSNGALVLRLADVVPAA